MKKNLKNVLLLPLLLAALPTTALAHTNPGAGLQVSASQNFVTFGGASGNLSGLSLGVKGVSRRLDGAGVRARLSYAVGGGASLEALAVRVVAYPRQGISPYTSVGVLDLSALSGATATTTSYSINPTTGVINPTTTTVPLSPTGVVMGYGFVGLRAHRALNPRLSLTAHAALGTGVGGSTTGLPASSGTGNALATSLGVGMRYRVTKSLDAALTYTRIAIPVRGTTFQSSGIAIQASYLFH